MGIREQSRLCNTMKSSVHFPYINMSQQLLELHSNTTTQLRTITIYRLSSKGCYDISHQ